MINTYPDLHYEQILLVQFAHPNIQSKQLPLAAVVWLLSHTHEPFTNVKKRELSQLVQSVANSVRHSKQFGAHG